MTNTASKLKRAICSMVVMLALVAGITSIPVLAASNGIYTATATSHYKHPTTGKSKIPAARVPTSWASP